jgi:hypothetical protein
LLWSVRGLAIDAIIAAISISNHAALHPCTCRSSRPKARRRIISSLWWSIGCRALPACHAAGGDGQQHRHRQAATHQDPAASDRADRRFNRPGAPGAGRPPSAAGLKKARDCRNQTPPACTPQGLSRPEGPLEPASISHGSFGGTPIGWLGAG